MRLGHRVAERARRWQNVKMDVVLTGIRALVKRNVDVVAVLLLDCLAEAVEEVVNRLQLRWFKRAQFADVPRRQHHKMAFIQRLNVGNAEAVRILVDEPVVLILCPAQGAVVVHAGSFNMVT